MTSTLAWLLDGDPAVRWQVMADLLDHPADEVARERARVATNGWGARLLAEQDPSGTWAGTLYSPKWTSTTYTLLLLRDLGLPTDHPQAQAGVAALLDGARHIDGGLTLAKTVPEPETCITAMLVGLAATFGMADQRVLDVLAWLLDQQLADGGFNCETIRSGSRHGSFDTTIVVLEALQAWADHQGTPPAVAEAAERGREFFCAHRLYCSHRTGEVVAPSYTRIVFPPGWHHDLLRGLEHFRAAAAHPDPRLGEAIDRLRSKQRDDGTWAGNANHPGRYWFRLEPAGRPSRIQTLRAQRVLRWWDGQASSAGRRATAH